MPLQRQKGAQMIILLKNNPDPVQLEDLTGWLRGLGLTVCPTVGVGQTILGLVGDTSRVDMDLIAALDIIRRILSCRSGRQLSETVLLH